MIKGLCYSNGKLILGKICPGKYVQNLMRLFCHAVPCYNQLGGGGKVVLCPSVNKEKKLSQMSAEKEIYFCFLDLLTKPLSCVFPL